jgi:hypothetical protein
MLGRASDIKYHTVTPLAAMQCRNADIQIFWVVSLAWSESNNDARRQPLLGGPQTFHATPLTHNSVPIKASLDGLARCSIAHADGSRSFPSGGSEPLGFVSRKKSGLSRAQPQLKTWPSPGSLSYWFACMRATTVSDEADRALPRIAECPLQLNTKHA